MLNRLLGEEADEFVVAERYRRIADREACWIVHYEWKLMTTSGGVTSRMAKLKGMRFSMATIRCCRSRETSVEDLMIEMYLAGVSTRRIEDVSEIQWDSSVSATTVSNLSEKVFVSVEEWGDISLERMRPYVQVDAAYSKTSCGGSYEKVAMLLPSPSMAMEVTRP